MKKQENKNLKKLSFEKLTILEFKNLKTIVGGQTPVLPTIGTSILDLGPGY